MERDFLALPDGGRRIELIDGTLLVHPLLDQRHQRISARLGRILDAAAPADVEVLKAINVRLAPDRIVIPDVVVLTIADHLVTPAAEVLMIVEVVSPSTEQIDRLLKMELAAQAGIPWFVLVEPDGPIVTVHELDNGSYRQVATATGDERLVLAHPFELDFRPAELLASRRA